MDNYHPSEYTLLYPKFNYWEASEEKIKQETEKAIRNLPTDKIWLTARELFKDYESGEPFQMTPGELAIFKLIVNRQYRFSQILCGTQYGKTFTVARAVLARIASFPEDWVLVVPDYKRGKILLDYIIKDTSTNEIFKKKLVGLNLNDRHALSNLLEERSKLKLTFQIITDNHRIRYSSVRILTTEARKKTDTINAIMGFGSRNIIFDEAALVDDNIDSGVFRMIAGKGKDTFLCKIGNPFYRNHFYNSWKDPKYRKIFINDQIGIMEGRYDEETLNMAMKKPQYDILFKCQFPSADAVDSEGFTALLTPEELNLAYLKIDERAWTGEKRMGVDVARGGGNYNVFTLRCHNYAYIIDKNRTSDLMDVASQVVLNAKKVGIKKSKAHNIFIDDTGVGGGVTDACHKMGWKVTPVKVGKTAIGNGFYNRRAKNYWRLKDWIKAGGKLNPEDDWNDLLTMKYKTVARGGGSQIQMISKDKLRSLGINSPDTADSLMLTFARPDRNIYEYTEEEENREDGFDPYDCI